MAKLILKAPYYKQGHKTEDGRGRGGYAEYIATREGVELLRGGMVNYIGQRKGSCGLFSDEGVEINLRQLSRELNSYQGNLWTVIISLSREAPDRHPITRIDRKQRRQIDEKKLAQGMKLE